MVSITQGVFRANAALPQGANPLPHFRSPNHDENVRVKNQVPLEYQHLMGLDCGKRYLPYQLQDRYDRNRKEQDIEAIIMENAFLKATFLPTLGGRLISLYDKNAGKELLYCNTSIQTCNLSNLDAWFAGGIEWNIGQYGHSYTTCSPVFAATQTDKDGIPFLRLYEFERCKGLWWHIDFHLGSTSKLLYAQVHLYNLNDETTSLYYWTNAAIPVDDRVRVVASSEKALYLDPYQKGNTRLFGYMHMPHMEIYPDIDASYPNQFSASNEYFLLCDKCTMPWECAINGDGSLFFEVSNHPLSYRKMFCWGSHAGGKRWQRYLSPDSEDAYIELQSGLAPTQLHGKECKPYSHICWTQAFGSLSVDPQLVQGKPYASAMQVVEEAILTIVDADNLEQMHEKYLQSSNIPPRNLLQQGSGWGYLEQLLRGFTLPQAFLFPKESIGPEQEPYHQLLKKGTFPAMDALQKPLPPPPCSPAWETALQEALEKSGSRMQEIAAIKQYLGIIHLEQEAIARAQTCWLEVMELYPNAWTARNLAQLENRRGEKEEALAWYEKACQLPGYQVDPAIAEEYCALLIAEQLYERARAVFFALPPIWLSQSETVRILRAQLAVQEGDADLIKHLVFDREVGHIREGATPLNDLWLSYNLIRYTAIHPEVPKKEAIELVEKLFPIPPAYDFTLFRQ